MTLRDDIRSKSDAKPSSGKAPRKRHDDAIRLDGAGTVRYRRQEPKLSETKVRAAGAPPAPPERRRSARPTPGWKLLARGALAVALVVGLAAQVSGEGKDVQGDVTARISVAREALDSAREAFAKGDLVAAEDDLGVAQHSLHDANRSVASLGQQGGVPFSRVVGDRTVAVELLATGERFVGTARGLVRDVRTIPDAASRHEDGFYATGRILNDRVPALKEGFSELDRQLDLLDALSSRAAGSGLPQLREAGSEFQRLLPDARKALASGGEAVDQLPDILGEREFRRYLLWFQNPAELRPTGGFIGTLGELTLDRGAVKDLKVESIYNVANQANRTVDEPPPIPFLRFAEQDPPVWGLQDANWSPDFPTAAKRFQDFYEQGGRSTTDGVIALTVTPVEDMLRILGPVELSEYGYTLTADNFQTTIQDDQKERRVVSDEDPKKILRDFLPALLKKLASAPDAKRSQALAVVTKAAKSGDIQVYFDRERQEALLGTAKASGAHRAYEGALSLIDANIAGFKSSRDISTTLDRTVEVAEGGTVTESVAVERTHSGETETHDNLNYARLYLPPGSEVAETDGWNASELTDEAPEWGAVLGGWTDVPRFGTTSYAADFRRGKLDLDQGRMPLRYISQAGATVKVRTTVVLPDGYVWDGRDDATVEGRRIVLTGTARGDLVYDLTFKPVHD
ncbi:MAG TPA: DUF4012 domain-containing protein [Patescibacteria group bacterium]|jgi:hypothetical protein